MAPPEVVIRPPTPGAGLPAVIAPQPEFAWRRLVGVAVVILMLLGAALFAFRDEIATIVSYEARASRSLGETSSAALPDQPEAAPPASRPASPTSASAASSARPAPPSPTDAARPQIEVDLSASKIDLVDGRYIVRGQLVNTGLAPGSTTLLRLTFKRNEDVLGERSFALVQGPLPPGGRVNFSQTLDDPPSGTTDIVPMVE